MLRVESLDDRDPNKCSIQAKTAKEAFQRRNRRLRSASLSSRTTISSCRYPAKENICNDFPPPRKRLGKSHESMAGERRQNTRKPDNPSQAGRRNSRKAPGPPYPLAAMQRCKAKKKTTAWEEVPEGGQQPIAAAQRNTRLLLSETCDVFAYMDLGRAPPRRLLQKKTSRISARGLVVFHVRIAMIRRTLRVASTVPTGATYNQ